MVAGPENEPDSSSISNDVLHHTPSCPLENNNNEGRHYTNEGVVCVPYESSDPSTTNNKLQTFGNLEDTGTQTTFALSPYFHPPDIFIRFLHPSSIETILALKLWILDSESEILDPDGEQGEIGGEGEGEDTQPQRQQPIVQNNSSHLR